MMQPEHDKNLYAYGKQMMKSAVPHYDVVVVGASVGGSTAAILFAQEGLRVALIERNTDIDAYKKVCTHFIQPTATPTLKRLGLTETIEEAGGVRNSIDVWTRWGWVNHGDRDRFYGYNIRRQVLDPLLRHQAATTPGVDFLPGTSLRELVYRDNRVVGIRAVGPEKEMVDIRAQLVVGADGRHSRTAELAGLAAQVRPNNRFMYFAYFRNLSLTSGLRSQHWLLDPDVAYAMPNDGGITLLAVMRPKTELAAFKQDVPENFIRFFDNVPDGPNLRQAEQISKVIGMLDIPCFSRPTTIIFYLCLPQLILENRFWFFLSWE
jgi:2-polyprenyl-6-methoxyphenol hydroxylase-like FAD-dependent oxidoreductase